MTRLIFCLNCLFLSTVFSLTTHAQKTDFTRNFELANTLEANNRESQRTDFTKNFGIGFQGATPAFGGISFRYTGLAPIYLQTVGRFILNNQDSDHMLGAGVSYAIFQHENRFGISRLYFTLQGGWRDKRQEEYYFQKEDDFHKEIQTTTQTTTLGAGLAFGGELVVSLMGIPLGLNMEIGQGVGRETEGSQSKGIAGIYVGGGVHAYF